jgi:hypothetical protein
VGVWSVAAIEQAFADAALNASDVLTGSALTRSPIAKSQIYRILNEGEFL